MSRRTCGPAQQRLTLLLLAVSLAVIGPVAQAHAAPVVGGPTAKAAQAPADRDGDGFPDSSDQCPDAPGGSAYNGCPPPSNRDGDFYPDSSDPCPDVFAGGNGCPPPPDRDGDNFPDSSDRCPDERGANEGCPQSADRDGDGLLDMDDACPDTYGKQADGCQPFVWRYFFGTQGVKDFAADKPNDTTYCSGLPKCKTTHVTFTLSAATAKAAGITKRRIGSISVSVPSMGGFDRGISRANGKKLARLKKITVTIRAWVILATGKKIEAAEKTLTIKRYTAHQFNSDGTTDPEGI